MGLSGPLVLGPLVIMFLITTFGLAAPPITTTQVNPFCPGGSSSCGTNGIAVSTSTSQSATSVQYTCSRSTDCLLPYLCPTTSNGAVQPIPAGTYCKLYPLSKSTYINQWWLIAGDSVIVSQSSLSGLQPQPISSAPSTGASLVLGGINIGAGGFLVLITSATIIAVLGGLSFFGTGENTEGIHIAWVTALILGTWGILAALDGVISGSPNSFFVQLDGLLSGLGTGLFIFLTFVLTLGIVGTVSRSNGASGGV